MTRYIILGLVIVAAIASTPCGAGAEGTPESTGIPQRIVKLLAEGSLKKAIFEMRDASPCSKISYLMQNTNRIVLHEIEKKPSRSNEHVVYQNVAIAYHNLYLFLKTRGITQEDYLEKADSYYGKARRKGTHLHKAECDILRATLMAAGGNIEKARKKFEKIDEMMLRGDFESMEYLAAYYAAVRDLDGALTALKAAHEMDPKKTVAWLEVSDDFENLKDDPRYIAMKDSWRARNKKRDLVLSVPYCEEPRLEMTGADPFSPLGFSKKAKRQLKARRK